MNDAEKKSQGDEILEIFNKAALIMAFTEVGLKAFQRVQWLLTREGETFSDEEKADIMGQLAASGINLERVLNKAEAEGR